MLTRVYGTSILENMVNMDRQDNSSFVFHNVEVSRDNQIRRYENEFRILTCTMLFIIFRMQGGVEFKINIY